MNFVEECWFIYGFKIFNKFIGFKVYHSSGTSGGVEFNWKKALSKFLIGWVHTHPSGHTHASLVDDNTMKGWVIALGKPLLCAIVTDGTMRAWEYSKAIDSRHICGISRRKIHIISKGPFIIADDNKCKQGVLV